MLYNTQKKLIVSVALLGSFVLLPFLTYAETAIPIANPGVEAASSGDATFPEHWSKGFWGTNDAVFTYPALGGDGTKAAKVEIANYTNGDAKWVFEDVPAIPGEQYVFSDTYLANVSADIVARYTLSGGGYQYAYLGTSVISTVWTGYATLPFTVPAGALSLTVFHLIHEQGSLSIDNVSLHRQIVAITEPLLTTVKTPILPPAVQGGAVPLSYLLSHVAAPRIIPLTPSEPKPITQTPNQNQSPRKEPAIVGAVLGKINIDPIVSLGSLGTLTYTRTAEVAADKGGTSFVPRAEAAEKTPSNFASTELGAAPLGVLASYFPDLTLAFSGLMLIALSIGLTLFLLRFQNRQRERRTELWEP